MGKRKSRQVEIALRKPVGYPTFIGRPSLGVFPVEQKRQRQVQPRIVVVRILVEDLPV
ncbi:conserved hypothetical protein [Ricinus communis]|uniref:Uncharacterized protein n=1 Tax=Ricinus communis TaxID=3988 RepID=B9TEJ0_RICCO|nr:conserved hypothetical protein [Ricinus communis]